MRKAIPSVIVLCLVSMLMAQQAESAPNLQIGTDIAASMPSAPGRVTLPKHTEILLILLETVSSATAHKGQLVRMEVAQAINLDGITVVPAGTPALGVVRHVSKAVRGEHNGSIQIEPLRLEIPNGSPIGLRDGFHEGGGDPDGVCSGFVNCLPVDVIGALGTVAYLAALPFARHIGDGIKEGGEDVILESCSRHWAETSRKVVVLPALSYSSSFQ